jgi:FlaA1/EpsC-like NDP-sugar epimerase
MQAAVIGDGGEIFVLDMGEPVKIRYLAEQMIRLSGREPDRDVPIQYIGLRPGEKLYEELFYASEDLTPTRHPKIRVARGAMGSGQTPGVAPMEGIDALARAAERQDTPAMLLELAKLIPGWRFGPTAEPGLAATAEPEPKRVDAGAVYLDARARV